MANGSSEFDMQLEVFVNMAGECYFATFEYATPLTREKNLFPTVVIDKGSPVPSKSKGTNGIRSFQASDHLISQLLSEN